MFYQRLVCDHEHRTASSRSRGFWAMTSVKARPEVPDRPAYQQQGASSPNPNPACSASPSHDHRPVPLTSTPPNPKRGTGITSRTAL